MRRRQFITLLGGTAIWPLRAEAQQGGRLRKIGVLMGLSPNDKEAQLRIKAFESTWPELGWIEGRNIHVDYRWAPGEFTLMRNQNDPKQPLISGNIAARLRRFEEERDRMIDTIRAIVQIESPSDDKSSVDRVGRYVSERFAALGGAVRINKSSVFGDHGPQRRTQPHQLIGVRRLGGPD